MSGRRELSLCVFVDALGWEIARRHPLLDDVLVCRGPLETVLGYSCTCDPTILTGKMPREHGHFSFFRYDPEASPFAGLGRLDLLPRWITSRDRVRRCVSRRVAQRHGFTGYFQLYHVPFGRLGRLDYSEKRDLYQPGGILGGVPTIFDHLREREIPFALSDWRMSEEHNLAALETQVGEGDVRFAYLYLAGLDGILHAHGTRAPEVARKIAWYDARLRRLLDAAHARYDAVRMHVFSDHGMTDVTATCNVQSVIDRLGLHWGVDYAAVYDSTMARFWFLNERAREMIEAALSRIDQGRMLDDDDLARWGVDFSDRRYGERFFLLDPGVLLCPSDMGPRPVAGMHGYDPSHADSTAMFASSVPLAERPAGLADLYGLMRSEADRVTETDRATETDRQTETDCTTETDRVTATDEAAAIGPVAPVDSSAAEVMETT